MSPTLLLTAARVFSRIRHPVPKTFAAPRTYYDLLEFYSLSRPTREIPLMCMFPIHCDPFPQLIQGLDATLWTAFNRPYHHTLYSAASNLQNLQPLPYTLLRQWIHMTPRTLSVVSFLEPADHPRNRVWSKYWCTINDRHSTPPPAFWSAKKKPLMICQDAAGVLQWGVVVTPQKSDIHSPVLA